MLPAIPLAGSAAAVPAIARKPPGIYTTVVIAGRTKIHAWDSADFEQAQAQHFANHRNHGNGILEIISRPFSTADGMRVPRMAYQGVF
jgi:hypothetical protein